MTQTMTIRQPTAGTKRALVVIDAQPATLQSADAERRLALISAYIAKANYSAYVVARYHAPADSMFARQCDWQLSPEDAGPSDEAIDAAIAATGRPVLAVEKTTRSIFKARSVDARAFLDAHGIDELHICGFDVNDCLMATAYDAIDLGYFSYVIEECSGRTDANPTLIEAALTVLRWQGMTNTSNHHGWTPVSV